MSERNLLRNHNYENILVSISCWKARRDLWLHLNDCVSAAHSLIENLFVIVESLADNSERGRIVPESNREDVRELFEGEYRIIYKLESKKLFILTIRNFKQVLSEEDLE